MTIKIIEKKEMCYSLTACIIQTLTIVHIKYQIVVILLMLLLTYINSWHTLYTIKCVSNNDYSIFLFELFSIYM